MNRYRNRVIQSNGPSTLPIAASVSAAVLLALYGLPSTAHADQSPDSHSRSAPVLQEVVVTAERVKETIWQVPGAISVVTPRQLTQNSVTDLPLLTREIGIAGGQEARNAASAFPIIRGLNASPSISLFRTLNQAPVGTYLDNSPVDGYFQLTDVKRIEVLRGPQGTLYGAGALGGAIRIIPNPPELGKFSGEVGGKLGFLNHAGTPTYTVNGMVNIPIGDTLAFRAAAVYEYLPGYINAYGLLKRSGPLGIPVLANPGDPVNSSGVYTSKHDWNYQGTLTGRASFLWKPVSSFSAVLAFTYSHANGDASPTVNPVFPGGPYVVDPRITLPPGGRYTAFSPTDQPYSRKLTLTSLDMTYDAGFATVSSTTSYFTNSGSFVTSPVYGLMQPVLLPYVTPYAGTPINPRWIAPFTYQDSEHNFSQEVRLASNPSPARPIDYVLGVFYEKNSSLASSPLSDPGSPERAVAQGCTAPIYPGSSFPDCLLLTGPNDEAYNVVDKQFISNKSIYGDVTYHFARNWQVTGGIRYYKEDFKDTAANFLYDYGLEQPLTTKRATFSKTVGKADISYEYLPGQHVYVLWSQGFRRGGANSLLLKTGAFADEAPSSFGPDMVSNYEIGFKGHFPNTLSYAFDGFYMPWKNPQICGLTPESNYACWNARKAVSEGFEFHLDSPLFVPGLRIMLVGTYANAHLTESYSYPDYFGNIVGYAGEQLPLSPKESGAATLSYTRDIGGNYILSFTLNDTYTSMEPSNYFAVLGQKPTSVPALDLVNASVSVVHNAWRMGIYSTNLTNKYEVLSVGGQGLPIAYNQTINQPRMVYIGAAYSF